MTDKVIEITPSYFLQSHSWDYGQRVIIKARIVGYSRRVKNVPKYMITSEIVSDPNTVPRVSRINFSKPNNYDLLRNYMFARGKLLKTLREYAKALGYEKFKIEESIERLTLIELVIRDIYPERTGETYVYNDFPVILVGEALPPYSKCYLEGYIIDDDKNRTTALIYSVRPIAEDFESLVVTDEDKKNFEKYFRNANSLIHYIDRTIDPKIVGREFAKLAVALTLHSPLELNFIGTRIRGTLHCLFNGSSKTGKSDIMQWILNELNLGEFGTGEAGKRTGLLFTVDTERDAIIWGLLVQADRRLALIDGLQRLSSEEISEFREALRQKKIVVRMKVSGEAPARCRIIAAANPYRPLEEYVDLAEAIRDTKTFKDPVDITRWDIFVRFHSKDVPDEEIARAEQTEPMIPLNIFRKHVLWAWSLKPDDIVFTNEAVKKIRESYIDLVKYSTPKLPMVHKGYLEVIARISAAYAVLIHNVVDGKVIVDEKTVDKAVNFIDTMLSQWEYREYVARLESILELTEEDYKIITDEFDRNPLLERAFMEIGTETGIKLSILTEKLNVGRGDTLTAIARLKALGLVETETKQSGYRLTKKGVTLYRRLRKERGQIPSKLFKLSEDEEKLYSIIKSLVTEKKGPVDTEEILNKVIDELGITSVAEIENLIKSLEDKGYIYQVSKDRWSLT